MRLRYTSEALADLAQVLGGLAGHSPQGAKRVRARIRKAVALLAEHPFSGQRTSYPTMRRVVLAPYPYLIFYRVTETEMVVLGVRHAARDPAAMPDAPR